MEMLLERLMEECREYTRQGAVANYIPALAKADLILPDGKKFTFEYKE